MDSRRESMDEPLILGLSETDDDEDLLGIGSANAKHETQTLRRRKMGKSKKFSSLVYDNDESEVWRYFEAKRHFADRGKWWSVSRKRSTKRWLLVAATGVLTAAVGLAAGLATSAMSDWKFRIVRPLVENGNTAQAYFAFLAINFMFVSVAALAVLLEPVAAGSGIPEVKCFLNGINLPRVMRFKTLVCKIAGVAFSVSSGLPCGKEGPMIHGGACVGAGISQGKSSTMKFDVSFQRFQEFRNDREKRDFVACGAAAGVCTAFQAPIGGVLFALEEGSSHWSAALTWRTFFCTMITLWTLYVFESLMIERSFTSDGSSMFNFGKFYSLDAVTRSSNYYVYELLMFMLIGCLGGLIGGCFNLLNRRITLLRKWAFGFTGTVSEKIRHKSKLGEVFAVSFMMSTIAFCVPLMWSTCRPLPTHFETSQEQRLVENLVQFQCANGTYNEMASLLFTNQNTAIRHLFHFRETGSGDLSDEAFSPACLAVFFLLYTAMAVITYGLAVPSGLFVPSLLSGAAFGRLCGNLLHRVDAFHGNFADAGTYSLIGAVASLGGMARMTISLTVIMLEATGDMQYVLPLMITLMAARWTGNMLCDGLYDIHIHLNDLPILEADCPRVARTHDMVVREIMSPNIVSVQPVMQVGHLYDLVTSNTHGSYPVVRDDDQLLQGTISRNRIAVLFQKRAFGKPIVDTTSFSCDLGSSNPQEEMFSSATTKIFSPLVEWNDLERPYPRYPVLDSSIKLDDEDREKTLDLRPYVNTSPYTMHESASVKKAYGFFRLLGLRQLCIIDHMHRCLGVVTRHDLIEEHIYSKHKEFQAWESDPSKKPPMTPRNRRNPMPRRLRSVVTLPAHEEEGRQHVLEAARAPSTDSYAEMMHIAGEGKNS